MSSVKQVSSKPHLVFHSVGVKNQSAKLERKGKPELEVYALPRADIYLDCRSVREPNGVPGADAKAQEMIMSHSVSNEIVKHFKFQVQDTVSTFIPLRRVGEDDPYKRPIHVMCMCAHGMNRSVAVKHILAESTWPAGWTTEVIHGSTY